MPRKFWSYVILISLILGSTANIYRANSAGGVSVHIRIEGSTSTLADEDTQVADCVITDSDGATHNYSETAACALIDVANKHGLTTKFKDSGFGLMLMQIGDDDTPGDWSKSWSFWVNDDSASVGVDSYKVSNNDSILLTFGAYTDAPLRVTAPASTTSGTPTTFTVEQRHGETDANWVWHGSWLPAANATLKIGTAELTVPADGKVTTTITAAGDTKIQAYGDGFVRSAVTTISVSAITPSPSPSATPTPAPTPSPQVTPSPPITPTPTPSPSPTPTANVSYDDRHDAAMKALSYLKSHQDDDGKIGGDVATAWSVMAFGANEQTANSITQNGNSLLGALSDASLDDSATDIERQILAIRASGANPASFNGHNYVAELKSKYSHNQIGNEDLINDDVFGVLALIASGVSTNSSEITNTVKTIMDKQSSDGSWTDSIDMTAAAVQSLSAYVAYEGNESVDDALSRAREYLAAHQDSRGGFGNNSASTSWAIQGIFALGEDPSDWRQSDGDTPWSALLSYQNSNGSFGWQSKTDTSALMTAYAVPALLETTWPITSLTQATTNSDAVITYKAPQTVTVAASSVVKSPSPQVAGAMTTIDTPYPQSTVASTEVSPSPSPEITPTPTPSTAATAGGFVPINRNDQRFAFTLFGLANMGIGVSITRLLSKLFV